MNKLATIILLLTAQVVLSQVLPPERATDWTLAGFKGSRNVDYTVVNFQDEGGVPDGATSNDLVYSAILDDLAGSPAVIYFPPGEYFFNSSLQLRSNLILRGESSDATTLLFDLGGSGDLIRAQGSRTNVVSDIVNAPEKEDRWLIVNEPVGFVPGDYIQLTEEDDTLITSDWALGTSGQVVIIDSIVGDTLFLQSPLRRAYLTGNQPDITKLQPHRFVGIEQMEIIRLDATESQTSNIKFSIVADSWIDCVASYNSNFCHIDLRTCTNIDVTGSYMQDAFAYGGGGQGYGVVLHSTTGECLVTDNRFKHLRHSMLLQSGANGNVVSYNYSEDPFWSIVPNNSAGDLVLHGNYPYLNLFEGNDVAHIVIDESHGINGPYNTVFRNRAHLYGIFMSPIVSSPLQNIIGNEVTNPNPIMGFYIMSGWGRLEYGNNVRGQIIPAGTGDLDETSLYLDEAPQYYQENGNWPPIGVPNAIGSHDPEAEVIYDAGFLTTCAADLVLSIEDHSIGSFELTVGPVPTNHTLLIRTPDENGIERLEVFSMAGKAVYQGSYHTSLSATEWPSGMYFLRATDGKGRTAVRKVIVSRH